MLLTINPWEYIFIILLIILDCCTIMDLCMYVFNWAFHLFYNHVIFDGPSSDRLEL